MRVRIQQGQRSIEVEGDQSEVVLILQGWWSATQGGDPLQPDEEDQNVSEDRAYKKRVQKRTVRKSPEPRDASSTQVDAESVANQIRESDLFETIEQKLIVGNASRIDRARFISWFLEDTPITSGDLLRVMNALHVKMDAPAASKAFGDASNDFIKDSKARPSTYKLTARARKTFGEWLKDEKPAA